MHKTFSVNLPCCGCIGIRGQMCHTSTHPCEGGLRLPTCWRVLQAAAAPQEEAAQAAPAAEREAVAEPAEPRADAASAAHAPPGRDHAAARDSAPAGKTEEREEEEEELDLPSAPTTRLEPMEQLRAAAAQRGRALAVEEPQPAW